MLKDRRKDVIYGSFVCSIRQEKEKKNQVCSWGDRINYPGGVSTPAADKLVAKLLFNSVASTKNAKFTTMDIPSFYLMIPLKRPEYIQINLRDIPEEIILEYNLRGIAKPN